MHYLWYNVTWAKLMTKWLRGIAFGFSKIYEFFAMIAKFLEWRFVASLPKLREFLSCSNSFEVELSMPSWLSTPMTLESDLLCVEQVDCCEFVKHWMSTTPLIFVWGHHTLMFTYISNQSIRNPSFPCVRPCYWRKHNDYMSKFRFTCTMLLKETQLLHVKM